MQSILLTSVHALHLFQVASVTLWKILAPNHDVTEHGSMAPPWSFALASNPIKHSPSVSAPFCMNPPLSEHPLSSTLDEQSPCSKPPDVHSRGLHASLNPSLCSTADLNWSLGLSEVRRCFSNYARELDPTSIPSKVRLVRVYAKMGNHSHVSTKCFYRRHGIHIALSLGRQKKTF